MEEQRIQLINKIIAYVNKKLPLIEAKLAIEFIQQYYSRVALDDLLSRDVLDLYGAVLSHWRLVYQRLPGECKIQIYNPQFEQQGWQSKHTIIEIAHDDMPFLVDSLRMEINRLGYNTHLMIHLGGMKLRRNAKHQVMEVLPFNSSEANSLAEAPIYIEIDKETELKCLEELRICLQKVLQDVTLAVSDWHAMRERLLSIIQELKAIPPVSVDSAEVAESIAFLEWLYDNHFTFLGYREYNLGLIENSSEQALFLVEGSGLGVLRNTEKSLKVRPIASLPPEARRLAMSPQILTITKSNTVATVHRPVYSDYLGIRKFDPAGKIIGEYRFIGLYTSVAYNSNPKHIPFLRHKVEVILQRSGYSPAGHAGKELINILETLPRDDLLQASVDELFPLAMGILNLQERNLIRLFVRKDVYNRFISCLVYLPREDFNTQVQNAMQEILQEDMHALEITSSIRFSESVLARIHFLIRIDPNLTLNYDLKATEAKLIAVGRPWRERLTEGLIEAYGEELGNRLAKKYADAFPAGYIDDFDVRTAVYDIGHINNLTAEQPLGMSFYSPLDEEPGTLRFKLFLPEHPIPLSDVLPMLENMGLKVMGERPHEIVGKDGSTFWINDFGMRHIYNLELNVEEVKDIFQDAFQRIWHGIVENDGFNRLVLGAKLNWREVVVLRAYAKYFRQIGFTFSQPYIEETLAKHADIAKKLVELFLLRMEPTRSKTNEIEQLDSVLLKAFDSVQILDEDRILRRYLDVIKATLRTNYYQTNGQKNTFKNYLAFKLDPNLIADMPLPRPKFEIFVYAVRFEGVHLRGGYVARGGIRWSDRREDFRTEILGLMKAQHVKNAVIVPSGAKGGFVAKCLFQEGNREAIMAEVVACYQDFIRGLLDITDNIQEGRIIPAQATARYDGDDAYLVVAADKGTATFSDIANRISLEYGFWLGDAFASGGSAGYDHKKMGITAKGAWESVKRHFRELGSNIQETDFTVIGIGDMSGDVFGNGMLLSKHIKLVAAFNHMHVFLDPNPNPEKSFKERERLFNLPRSTWEDYDSSLLSAGGGVYRRSAKSIKLSPEVQALLDLQQDVIEPNNLIRAILRARVDLIFNGGIGTYVKASNESHADVGDRTNDALRVNGNELRCKVLGEGGNLGCTQLGRIEYALKGGLNYTDFIDNSAGVDCSDHEVNIKILLNGIVRNGDITEKQRNNLLAEMTDEVTEMVLQDNYYQTQALSFAAAQANINLDIYRRFMDEQERKGKLDRALEFLPDDKQLLERKAANKGLTRPELAVLLAYGKIIIKGEILASDLTEDAYLSKALDLEFPMPLRKRFRLQMEKHSLRREIIATHLSNAIINEMGIVFVHRLQNETGASVPAIVRAYNTAHKIFEMREIFSQIEALDYKVPASIQLEMMLQVTRLVRRATRWFLRNRRIGNDLAANIEKFSPGIVLLRQNLSIWIKGTVAQDIKTLSEHYNNSGAPIAIANRVASSNALFSALDIIYAANEYNFSVEGLAKVYFVIGEALELNWFREQITAHAVENHWDGLARAALRDDLDSLQRGLAVGAIHLKPQQNDEKACVEHWLEQHQNLVQRWQAMLADLRSLPSLEFIVFYVAVRELLDLTQASMHVVSADKLKKTKIK